MVPAPHQVAKMLGAWATCVLGVRPAADVGLKRDKNGVITLWAKAGKDKVETKPDNRCADSLRYAETVFSMAARDWRIEMDDAARVKAQADRAKARSVASEQSAE